MPQTLFNPFSDRLSRDIRNGLSHSFAADLKTGELTASRKIATQFLNATQDECYRTYIDERLRRYTKILEDLQAPEKILYRDKNDPLEVALHLWDTELFFEVHEILEQAWHRATGEEKIFFQAMIRAAGAYVKAEAGQLKAAKRIAEKARSTLTSFRERLSLSIDPELLLSGLRDISKPPPKLLTKRNP